MLNETFHLNCLPKRACCLRKNRFGVEYNYKIQLNAGVYSSIFASFFWITLRSLFHEYMFSEESLTYRTLEGP